MGVKVKTAAKSMEHDGVNLPGRIAAIVAVLAIGMIGIGVTYDRWFDIALHNNTIGIEDATALTFGLRRACVTTKIRLLNDSERSVCFDLNQVLNSTLAPVVDRMIPAISESGNPIVAVDTNVSNTNVTGNDTLSPSMSPTISPSRSPTISPTRSPTISPSQSPTSSVPLNATVTTAIEYDDRDMCQRIGGAGLGGPDFCTARLVAAGLLILGILAGVLGDVMSEKVHVNGYSSLACGIFVALGLAACLYIRWAYLELRGTAIGFESFNRSFWMVLAGTVGMFIAAYLCYRDVTKYPMTIRYGMQNDGMGVFSRPAAFFGFGTWMLFAVATVLPFWSETDNLGSETNYNDIGLSEVDHATWGLLEYCISIPIAVLSNEKFDVCLNYDEEVTFYNEMTGGTTTTTGCDLFRDLDNGLDVCTTRLWVSISLGVATLLAVVGDAFSEKSLYNVVLFTFVSLGGLAATIMWWSFFQDKISGPKVFGAASEVKPAAGLQLCALGLVCSLVTLLLYTLDHCGVCAVEPQEEQEDDDDDDNFNTKMFTCCCLEDCCYGSDLGPFMEYDEATPDYEEMNVERHAGKTEEDENQDEITKKQLEDPERNGPTEASA
eukprot:m.174990 g.174990  ORF g.174990 m.174990 type:complete len:606 (-) comp31793_c0_seq1:60-1877(-)